MADTGADAGIRAGHAKRSADHTSSMQSLLLFMLRLRQPKHVLEIGTAVGFSALLMRSELLPDATLDTIEKVPARICDAKENFAKYPQGDKIRLLEGDAADILAALVRRAETI